jgi:hypothetical protein
VTNAALNLNNDRLLHFIADDGADHFLTALKANDLGSGDLRRLWSLRSAPRISELVSFSYQSPWLLLTFRLSLQSLHSCKLLT